MSAMEYWELWDYIHRPPASIVSPTGPLYLPSEDPDWKSPVHTQQVANLFRRLTHFSAVVCTITALEITFPEFNELAAYIPESLPDRWYILFPTTIQYLWQYLHEKREEGELILLQRELNEARTFLSQAAEAIEQGALHNPRLVIPYLQVTITVLEDLAASYEIVDLYRLIVLLDAAEYAIRGTLEVPTSAASFALAITNCFEDNAKLLQRWWQLCRRRLAMRDV